MKTNQETESGWGVIPRLVIPLEVWQKLMAYVLLCPAEINGFGMVHREGNIFVVEQVFITKQTVTGGSADVDQRDVHRLLYEMTEQGIDTGKLRLQWHSHVDMSAYFSPTDTANIEGYGDWMISLVVNKRGEFECRLDVFKPFRFKGPVDVTILLPGISADVMRECRQGMAAYVREPGMLWTRPARLQASDESPRVETPLSTAQLERPS